MKRIVKYAAVCIFFIIFISVYSEFAWLVFTLLFLFFFIALFNSKIRLIQRIKGRKFLFYSTTFLVILACVIVVRVFLFEIYLIPSSSMEDSLIEGDKVLLSKIHYGPIMPSSPKKLPWVNFFFYKLKYSPKWPYKRFSGLTGIKRNDIIIFTLYNYSANAPLIKRCIGLPGDTVQIINSLLFVNGKVYKNPSSVKYTYKIYSKEIEVLENALKEMSITFDRIGKVCVKTSVNSDQVFILNTLKYVDSLKLNVERESYAFPNNSNFTWTTNNLGPIIIPFKGMKVRIPSKVASLYKEIIDQENYNPLDSSHSDRIINTDSYTFKDNYYYVLGDNRDNSMDSRYFGFVPFKLIEGKATFILIPSISRKRYMTTFFKLL